MPEGSLYGGKHFVGGKFLSEPAFAHTHTQLINFKNCSCSVVICSTVWWTNMWYNLLNETKWNAC